MNLRYSLQWHASNHGYTLTDAEVEAILVKSINLLEAKRRAVMEASRAYDDFVIARIVEAVNGRPPAKSILDYISPSPSGGTEEKP